MLTAAIPFRVFVFMIAALSSFLCIQNYFFMSLEVFTVTNFVMDSIINIVFTVFLILASHTREMTTRKKYNLERIYNVEIEKTEELLAKLVPFHILNGIKNDQRIFDQLDNVTMLYAELVFVED